MNADLTRKRLQKEFQDCQNDLPASISINPFDDNLFEWTASIIGPEGSPYEGGKFKLDLRFPQDYPYKAPNITFSTPIYHPNVDSESGFIGLGVLNKDWTPNLTISRVLISLSALLYYPDLQDAVMPEIACEIEYDPAEYERKACRWTKRFAGAEQSENLKKVTLFSATSSKGGDLLI